MADEDPYVPPAIPETSTADALKKVHEKYERLRRNRQAVAFCSAQIPLVQDLLEKALESAKYYAESVVRLQKQLAEYQQRFDFAVKYCEEYSDDYEKVKLANELAAKIAKLTKALIEKRKEIAKMMDQK